MTEALKLITRVEKEYTERLLIERGLLSQSYTQSSESRGRAKPDTESKWRTCFERDVDRIIYSLAYRRLRNKTQVVPLPVEQHLTTRLTHTEEVYQVARGISSFLGLNKTLAEAIARGHDLGHTPFGHAGEKVLEKIMQDLLGDSDYIFHHARYGLEIVDRVEKEGHGLNLTEEVRDGILKHSAGASGLDDSADIPITPEGRIVRYSDKIVYLCSDVDDLLRVGMIMKGELPADALKVLGPRKSRWIGTLNSAVVKSSLAHGGIAFDGPVFDAFEKMREFMYGDVYGRREMQKEFSRAKKMICDVFEHAYENRFRDLDGDERAYKTLDFVACMTDQSIWRYFHDNLVPQRYY